LGNILGEEQVCGVYSFDRVTSWSRTMVSFTAHNIRLDDGTTTKPEIGYTIDQHVHFLPAKRLLSVIFPAVKADVRLADLGCLEGGYSVEFARMGFNVLGIEARESNIAACNLVKQKTNLPNLAFLPLRLKQGELLCS
jgi:2-polyprenyl-3-methyl-5-hydroxy-6-metoxy-1,4-benzoquinol methylase